MKKAYFIADLHLGATADGDSKATERRIVDFLDSIKEDAGEIYLMGDILDYWFEYRHVVPRGYVRFFGKLAELSDKGIRITWLIGNHDIWIFDYLPAELGINVVDGILETEVLGTRFSLQHGDAIGGGKKFRFLRAMFRNPVLQKLYSGIHPRWTVGFAYGCSRRSRLNELKRNQARREESDKEVERSLEEVKKWCEERISAGDKARYYLFGHFHREYRAELPDGRLMIALPDWPSGGGYATFDGESLCVKYERAGQIPY